MTDVSDDKVAAPTCFVIGPIGDQKAPVGAARRLTWEESQEVLETIIEPACAKFDITPLRADKISRAGEIPEQVFVALRDRDLVIADLSGANPNVMYELALRHAVGKCVIAICQYETLPYDVQWVRAIEFTRTPLGFVNGRKELEAAIEEFIRSGCDRLTATRIIRDGGRAEPVPAVSHDEAGDEDQEQPGFVDVVAEMESAFPRLTADLEEISVEIQQMGALGQKGSNEIQEANASGQGMSGRLPIIARYANALSESADRLEPIVARYSSDIQAVDAGMNALLDRLEAEPELQQEAPGFLPTLIGMRATATESFGSSEGLATTMEKLIPLAKVLRPPVRRVAAALRSLRTVSEPVFMWAERAELIQRGGSKA